MIKLTIVLGFSILFAASFDCYEQNTGMSLNNDNTETTNDAHPCYIAQLADLSYEKGYPKFNPSECDDIETGPTMDVCYECSNKGYISFNFCTGALCNDDLVPPCCNNDNFDEACGIGTTCDANTDKCVPIESGTGGEGTNAVFFSHLMISVVLVISTFATLF